MYRGLRRKLNQGLLAVLEEREELRQEELRQAEVVNRERINAYMRARQYRGMMLRRAERKRREQYLGVCIVSHHPHNQYKFCFE